MLRGDRVAALERARPPFWRWDRFGRQLFMSTRHLSEATAAAMLDSTSTWNLTARVSTPL